MLSASIEIAIGQHTVLPDLTWGQEVERPPNHRIGAKSVPGETKLTLWRVVGVRPGEKRRAGEGCWSKVGWIMCTTVLRAMQD